jgi:2-methylcitrate dehydratase
MPCAVARIENVKFKLVAAGMHGQSAVECAFRLHPQVKDRLDDIASITIYSQKDLMRVMDKRGPLNNPADRDHCVQYVVAVGLIHGKLEASDFEDAFAADPRIDWLRAKMTVLEDPRYSRDFQDPEKRSSANAIELAFKDGTPLPKVEIEYPLGHPSRRAEAIPMLEAKFRRNLALRFPTKRQAVILELCADQKRLEAMPVHEFVDHLVI